MYLDRYGDGRLENATDELCIMQFNSHYGSSGLLADVSDFARFLEALLDGEVIGPEALAHMTAPSFPGEEWRGSGIAIIDWMDSLGRSHRFYEMAGSGAQGMAQTRYFPAEQVTISCATNVGSLNRPLAHEHFYTLLDDLTEAVFTGRGGEPPLAGEGGHPLGEINPGNRNENRF
jgi:CubicO group peptidase (beta-lactamase class C family)